MGLRAVLHLFGHLLLPACVARVFWARQLGRALGIMLLCNLVDLDHLLADPIYDPGRCSIGTHPLHTLPAIVVYCLLLIPRPTRLVGVGLLLHMAWDQIDCWWMQAELG